MNRFGETGQSRPFIDPDRLGPSVNSTTLRPLQRTGK